MKKKALAVLLTASVIAGTMGGTATIVHADEEGKVINIYSWNDEFRQRLEAVYPEVKETSKDGTVTTLKEISSYQKQIMYTNIQMQQRMWQCL